MELEFDDDQEELRASIRTVLDRECSIGAVRGLIEARVRGDAEADDDLDKALWRTATSLDWPALTVPEDDGGIGLGVIELAVLAEELGRALAPGPITTTTTQLTPLAAAAGDHHRLEHIAAGELTGTLALAESGGWGLDAIATTATSDGDGWRLSGVKRHVIEAGAVDKYAAIVRTASGELAIAMVPGGAPVVELARPLDATRRIGTVHLDGVALDASDVTLVDESALQAALDEVVIAVALDIVGCCQAIFDTNLAYARDRVQFGVPIGSFQAVKHKLVNMYVALERARATTYFAVACAAEGDERRSGATAMAKAAAGDCQRLVASDGIQLLGGIGYTWEHDQHLYVRRAKADEALFGTTAHHRAKIATALGI